MEARYLSIKPIVSMLLAMVWALGCPAQSLDWQAEVRRQVADKKLDAALSTAEKRIAATPQDLEARGWRARLLGWMGRPAEAEAEYRRVMAAAPGDTDILLGLANVLGQQQKFAEALEILDRTHAIDASRGDVQVSRGRMLRALGRKEEARTAFREALERDPQDVEARAGLQSVEPEPRHEFVTGVDIDRFNYTSQAETYAVNLRSDLGERWISNVGGTFQERFGEYPARFLGSMTYRLTKSAALTVGGAAARSQGVIAKGEAFAEYGQGFRISSRGFLRGIEVSFRPYWLWFDQARVVALGTSVLLYFPREWMWSVQVVPARSSFPGTPAEWQPSGQMKLTFPVRRNLTGNVFWGVGTENFAQADQAGRFSARTYGGGWKWQFARRQHFSAYAFYQDRSQGRTQTSFGFAYGIRF